MKSPDRVDLLNQTGVFLAHPTPEKYGNREIAAIRLLPASRVAPSSTRAREQRTAPCRAGCLRGR
jgi:hypothetical protein